MCEIFGVSAKDKVYLNAYLKEFYKHSHSHPHGWGLGVIEGNEVNIEKEPLQATDSFYLKQRLTLPIESKIALAHIRYATIGNLYYRNCHPYTKKDKFSRRWTLVHNGTIFHYPLLDAYVEEQIGETDSERILFYIIDKINEHEELDELGRFQLLNDIFVDMTKDNNKVNIIITDGEIVYVHTNYDNSLYMLDTEGCVIFSTQPLSNENWKRVPFTTLLAYKDGRLLFTGDNHHHEYFDTPENTKYLYQIFSDL